MKPNELLVKIQSDFKDKIGFNCIDCGKEAEYLDKTHPDWYDFCKSQNRNPNESEFAFRKTCGDDCKGTLQIIEKTSFNSSPFHNTLSYEPSPKFNFGNDD